MDKRNVAILLFDGVEVLDFAGPFEVFSRTRLEPGVASRHSDETAPFSVFTVARSTDVVRATGDLKVIPDYSFEDAPSIDLLVVPGGFGTRALVEDEAVLDWIRRTAAAGIDMAFDVVAMLHGEEVAAETARYIEYPRR